jgi:hypothetical protein
MELRRTDWAVLLDDEKHGGWLVPILALATNTTPILKCVPTREQSALKNARN